MTTPDDLSIRVRQITWVGIWINLALSILKISIGLVGHSKALVADGIESGVDIATSLALIVGSRFWSAPPDKRHPYGHRRIETVLTSGIGMAVGMVGLAILWNALGSLREGTHSHPTFLVLVVAVVSVLAKEALFRWSAREGRKIKSMSVIANAWHHRSDAISSIPVVLAVGFAQFLPEWSFLDAIGAIFAGGFILKASFDILWPALREMVDTGAKDSIVAKLESIARGVEGVRGIHDLRTRHFGEAISVDLHVVVDPDISVAQGHRIGDEVESRMKAQVEEVCEVLVHLDPSVDL